MRRSPARNTVSQHTHTHPYITSHKKVGKPIWERAARTEIEKHDCASALYDITTCCHLIYSNTFEVLLCVFFIMIAASRSCRGLKNVVSDAGKLQSSECGGKKMKLPSNDIVNAKQVTMTLHLQLEMSYKLWHMFHTDTRIKGEMEKRSCSWWLRYVRAKSRTR